MARLYADGIEFPEIEDYGEYVEPEVTDDVQPDPDPDSDEHTDVPAADAGSGTPAEEPASAPAEPAAAVEDKPSEPSEIEQKAKIWDDISAKFAEDPLSVVRGFMQHLTPDQQAALGLKAPEAPAAEAPPWEPQSDAETHYAKHYKNVEQLPQFQEGVRQSLKGVEQAISIRDKFINDAHIEIASQGAKLDALMEMLDATFPDLDRKELDKALSDGKTSYRDAVNKVYKPHLSKAVTNKKQATKPRPSTPGNASGESVVIDKKADMATIFRKMFQ